MDTPETSFAGTQSFLRANQGLLYLCGVLAIPAFAVSVLIGLNPAFTAAILALFMVVSFSIQRWRRRRTKEHSNAVGDLSRTGLLSAVAVAVLIQLVPYGHSHSNGAVLSEPAWPSQEIRSLVVRGCFDCHSNEVAYPAYANIAPISWLVSEHVSDGREALNFSAFKAGTEAAGNIVEVVQEGSMPPPYFTRFGLHSGAKFSKAEISTLVTALRKMPEFKERRG
jgi:hypothetical protein